MVRLCAETSVTTDEMINEVAEQIQLGGFRQAIFYRAFLGLRFILCDNLLGGGGQCDVS
jgi:hypothetical protein